MVSSQNNSINTFIGTVFANPDAFDALTLMMSSLGVDEATSEAGYISLLFSTPEAVELLVLAVGDSSVALQAVTELIGEDVGAQIVFLTALGQQG